MGKKCILLFFVMIWTCSLSYSGEALAAGKRFDIQLHAGLEGHAKEGKGFPISLSIRNNGKDFSGDLVVILPSGNHEYKRVIPVQLASGAQKNLSFSVMNLNPYFYNGNGRNRKVRQIYLYEGSWKKGHEVKINPNLRISPNFISPGETMIGLLSRDPDALNGFSLMNGVYLVRLTGKSLPDQELGLDSLDALVIDDFPFSQLPDQVQNAVIEWVYRGGHLIIASEPGLEQQLGKLAKLLPLSVNGETKIHSFPQFKKWGKTPLKLGSLTLMTGKVNPNATVLAKNGNNPLLLEKPIGMGAITQFTFQLSDPALTSWKGFNSFLSQTAGPAQIASSKNVVIMNPDNRFTRISKMFDSISNLPLTILLIVLLVYLIIVIPVLYLLLKRLDKREWSWVVIPAFSIVFSLALFLYGAKDRLGPIQTHAVSTVFVDENGMGVGKGAVSMLSKTSGDYKMSIEDPISGYPINGNNFRGSRANLPVVVQNPSQNVFEFHHVEFWSPRSAMVQYPLKNYGGFAVHLVLQKSLLTGTIQNRTDYNFTELKLLSGADKYVIGALKAGETKKVSVNMRSGTLLQAPVNRSNINIYAGNPTSKSQSNRLQFAKQLLLDAAGEEGMFNVNAPVLIGFTKSSLYKVKVNDKATEQSGMSLFVEPVHIQLKGKNVPFNTDLKRHSVTSSNGESVEFIPTGKGVSAVGVGKGTYTIHYQVPQSISSHQYQLKSLNVNLTSHGMESFEIYDASKKKYIPLKGHLSFVFTKHPENYVENGVVQIRFIEPSGGKVILPEVIIKGVADLD
ncbi:MAG TPA: hypothetical protein VFK37_05650 [Bacillales bacterium]|nr:hypothetical protein [Bacillales bacterium]